MWLLHQPFNLAAVRRVLRMDVVYSHVCGLDVHKKNIVACTITPEGKEIRTFGTMTDDLILFMAQGQRVYSRRYGKHRTILGRKMVGILFHSLEFSWFNLYR
jgi:hypothetical protein